MQCQLEKWLMSRKVGYMGATENIGSLLTVFVFCINISGDLLNEFLSSKVKNC